MLASLPEILVAPNNNARALIAKSLKCLERDDFGSALLPAKTVVDDLPIDDVKLLLQGLECLRLACRGNGQVFFAEQYKRFMDVVIARGNQSEVFFPEPGVSTETDLEHEVVQCICKGWHRIGIPVIPSLDVLTYAWTEVDAPDRVREIYLYQPLPILLNGTDRPKALVACHDLSRGEEAFEYAARSRVLLNGVEFETVTAIVSKRFGVVARLPKNITSEVVDTGRKLREQGLQLKDLPMGFMPESPSDLASWGDKMTLLEAHLFALPLYTEASQRFVEQGDAETHLMMEIRRAGSLAALGNEAEAERVVLRCKDDAEEYGIDSVTALAERILARTKGKVNSPQSSFVFDPSTGKVIGGVLPEDAEHEFHACKALTEAWNEEYPGTSSPFSSILAITHFETDVLIKDTDRYQKMTLAQIVRLSSGSRLDQVDLKANVGKDSKSFLADFCSTLFKTLFVVHKRLNGTLSSPTGSALSAGNITAQASICDYETVLLPALGSPRRTREQTRVDLIIVFEIMLEVARQLDAGDVLVDIFLDGFRLYGTDNVSRPEVAAICDKRDSSLMARELAEYLLE